MKFLGPIVAPADVNETDESVHAARERRKELNAPEVKRRARGDRRYAAWLREAELDTEAEIEESRTLARAQKTAITELTDDLEALVDVLARTGIGPG